MNKPTQLGDLVTDLNKIQVHEFWQDYIKEKYNENAQLCYIDLGSFIIYIKTKKFYKDIAKDVKGGFDNSNYKIEKTLANPFVINSTNG